MGMGMGGSLLGDLAAGGIGYLMGRQSAQQAPQYQVPQYQPPANQQAPAASGGNERLAQLQLLGHLRDSGLLTNDEFEAEKRKILQGY
jgi:membrane protease subunit (stomatin/prohibitin family)